MRVRSAGAACKTLIACGRGDSFIRALANRKPWILAAYFQARAHLTRGNTGGVAAPACAVLRSFRAFRRSAITGNQRKNRFSPSFANALQVRILLSRRRERDFRGRGS